MWALNSNNVEEKSLGREWQQEAFQLLSCERLHCCPWKWKARLECCGGVEETVEVALESILSGLTEHCTCPHCLSASRSHLWEPHGETSELGWFDGVHRKDGRFFLLKNKQTKKQQVPSVTNMCWHCRCTTVCVLYKCDSRLTTKQFSLSVLR